MLVDPALVRVLRLSLTWSMTQTASPVPSEYTGS
jgi:hypothetical protein